jgi:hypothetical protein
LFYPRFGTAKLKILCISDSAFRVETASCLAMRGAVICLSEDHAETPGGIIHWLEFYSRRQRRVTRSTFAAETMSLSDAVEIGRVICSTFTAIHFPNETMSQLARREETGQGVYQLHGVVDCRSVFDHLASEELRIPSESSLILVLAGLKEQLLAWNLRTIWWVVTTAMLADGLNKGLITRVNLRTSMQTGSWHAVGDLKKHSESSYKPIATALQDA